MLFVSLSLALCTLSLAPDEKKKKWDKMRRRKKGEIQKNFPTHRAPMDPAF
jgi:hypothetical protein